MKTISTTLTTEAIFSEDNAKRYLLKKTWDTNKPSLAIIMLAPSEASGIALDNTTLLVLNNASRLGYGSVSVVNLFATLNDFSLKAAESEDTDNLNTILTAVQETDLTIYAPGVGKAKCKPFQERQKQVLTALSPYQKKLNCLCDHNGDARLQHPLSPAVRTWYLSSLPIEELLPVKPTEASKDKSTHKKRKT